MSEEWRWIPVSESPGEEPRKICVLKDGEKDVYWWTDTLGFEEDITHWCEVRYPPLPEPPKPPIQVVCEWLRIDTGWEEKCWARVAADNVPYKRGWLLWRIETELHRRVYDLHPTFEGEGWWRYRMARHPLGCAVSIHDADTRDETLLKAAKWLMEQEGSDDGRVS